MRFFADYHGVPEDPATGSANRCLVWYLVKHRYSEKNRINIPVEQGYEIRRPLLLLPKAEEKGGKIDMYVDGKAAMIIKGAFL